MSVFFLAAFFILFGVMHTMDTKIPGWVLGVLAFCVALTLLIDWKRKNKP